jgi:hypothetical protein
MVTGKLNSILLGHMLSVHLDKDLLTNIMGSTDKDFETVLAESTTYDSKITPGVVLLAVNKDGLSSFLFRLLLFLLLLYYEKPSSAKD